MKRRLILLSLLIASASSWAATATAPVWSPLPADIAREVDEFFTTMNLAQANNRIELVMALYTPDATEEIQIGAGAKFDLLKIRERTQQSLSKYVQTGEKPPVINRSNLTYQAGPKADSFLIRYTLYKRDASGGPGTPTGEIVYDFLRGERGIQIHSLVARRLGVTPPPAGAAPATSKYSLGRDGLPTEVELTSGVVLHQVTVAQWQPDKVVLKHLAGSDPIRFDRIIPEQRELFESRLAQGLAEQKQSYDRAAAVAEIRQRERSAEQASNEARAALAGQIDAAISEHRLLVGMTMDQVKRSWGLPTRSVAVDGTDGKGVMWVYDGRGIDPNGNVTTAGIGFVGDAVVQLFNVKSR